jgi:zinc transporter ZupT
MPDIKILSIILVLLVTFISGSYPFFKKIKTKTGLGFPIGESLACGVFLGAGLMHMLGDASQEFYSLHYDYPFAFLLAGASFLGLLLLEHVGQEIYKHRGETSAPFAILAVIMLSIHSFLAGAALGLTTTFSLTLIILLAILAHKWAASFSLAVQINKSRLPLSTGITLFIIFALMVPLGIIFGSIATHSLAQYPLVEPIFSSLAAGTFLYLGTLHGLERATLIAQCCNLKRFMFVIIGFTIMAVVAIWT